MSRRKPAVIWVCDACGAEATGENPYSDLVPPERWRRVKFGDHEWEVCGRCAPGVLQRVRASIVPPPEPLATAAPISVGPFR